MRVWKSAVALSIGLSTSVLAGPPVNSPRPETRPHALQAAASVTASQRPVTRPAPAEDKAMPVQDAADGAGFQDWIAGFRSRALAAGISATVFDRAFAKAAYDPDVVRRDRNQSEFTKTIWDYLDSAASDSRIANGKAALDQHRNTLAAIEQRYGVEKEIVVAIWGLESAYGAFRGSNNTIGSLATLAFDGRRAAFFEDQLMAALRILQSGDTSADDMKGSWAGAMGHTQFMPTSYLEYAVDFTGDGRRDIWADDPTDALASTAAYLSRFGWTSDQPWGVEVTLPDGFDYRLAARKIRKSAAAWAALGVRGLDGAPAPDKGEASVLLPAGGSGAAFLIYGNFAVIERYNSADAYVIGVGHLADRIRGGAAIQAAWPRGDRALTFDERQEMQKRLTALGFDTKGIDGKIGPLTIAAVRDFQTARGLRPDGYASLSLLQALR